MFLVLLKSHFAHLHNNSPLFPIYRWKMRQTGYLPNWRRCRCYTAKREKIWKEESCIPAAATAVPCLSFNLENYWWLDLAAVSAGHHFSELCGGDANAGAEAFSTEIMWWTLTAFHNCDIRCNLLFVTISLMSETLPSRIAYSLWWKYGRSFPEHQHY